MNICICVTKQLKQRTIFVFYFGLFYCSYFIISLFFFYLFFFFYNVLFLNKSIYCLPITTTLFVILYLFPCFWFCVFAILVFRVCFYLWVCLLVWLLSYFFVPLYSSFFFFFFSFCECAHQKWVKDLNRLLQKRHTDGQ